MPIVPGYDQGVAPAVGAGTQGTDFQAMAPGVKVDIVTPFEKPLAIAGKAFRAKLDEIGEARVLDATTRLKEEALRRRADPKDGYHRLRGINATMKDKDGRSLVDRETQYLDGYAQNLADSMGLTAAQAASFKKNANSIILGQYADATDHLFTESQAYEDSSDVAAISAAQRAMAANPGDLQTFNDSISSIQASAARRASRQGLSGQGRRIYIDDQVGMGVLGAINACVSASEKDNGAIHTAEAIYAKYRNLLTPDQILTADKAISSQSMKISANETADEFIASHDPLRGLSPFANFARAGLNTLRPGEEGGLAASIVASGIRNASGGKQTVIDPTTGKRVTNESAAGRFGLGRVKASDAQAFYKNVLGREMSKKDWEAIIDDSGANQTVAAGILGMKLRDYGDIESALAAYDTSDQEVRDAIERGGANWLSLMPKETQDFVFRVKKDFEASQKPIFKDEQGHDLSGLSPEYLQRVPQVMSAENIENYLKSQGGLYATSDEYRTAAKNAIIQKQKQKVDDFVNTQTNYAATLMEQYAANPRAGVNMELFNRLTLKGQEDFMAWKLKVDTNDKSGDRRLGDKILGDAEGHFANLVKVYGSLDGAEAAVKTELFRLSASDAKIVAQKWGEYRAAVEGRQDANSDAAVRAVKGQVDFSFSQANLDTIHAICLRDIPEDEYKKLTPEGQLSIRTAIARIIAEQGMMGVDTSKGSVALEKAVVRVLNQTAVVGGAFFDSTKPIYTINAKDALPQSGVYSQGQWLRRLAQESIPEAHGRDISDGEYQEFFIYFMTGMGGGVSFTNPEVKLPEGVKDYVTDKFVRDYRRKYGRAPDDKELARLDDLTIAREWVKMGLRGEKIPTRPTGPEVPDYELNGNVYGANPD